MLPWRLKTKRGKVASRPRATPILIIIRKESRREGSQPEPKELDYNKRQYHKIMPKKRKTKQIRINEINHRKLKLKAINRGQTISKLIDSIIESHFNTNKKNE